jgi:hypothetical protein
VVRRPQAAVNPVAAAFNGAPWAAAAPVALSPGPRAPLDPPTIRSLQDRIRSLLPPQLAAFSRAFRSVFQVP